MDSIPIDLELALSLPLVVSSYGVDNGGAAHSTVTVPACRVTADLTAIQLDLTVQARGNPATARSPSPAPAHHAAGGGMMEQQLMGLLSSVQDFMREWLHARSDRCMLSSVQDFTCERRMLALTDANCGLMFTMPAMDALHCRHNCRASLPTDISPANADMHAGDEDEDGAEGSEDAEEAELQVRRSDHWSYRKVRSEVIKYDWPSLV